jgi:hypothetical protein
LQDGEFQNEIQQALASEWAGRAKGIWSSKLDAIVNIAHAKLEEGITSLQNDPISDESDVDAFAFSDLAYPIVPTIALAAGGVPSINLAPFMASLKQRSSGRTPLLGAVLTSLEAASGALKEDVRGLTGSLLAEYQSGVKGALEKLRGILEESLADIPSGAGSVQCSLFVGRVALYIAKSSSLLGDLAGEDGAVTGEYILLHTIRPTDDIRYPPSRSSRATPRFHLCLENEIHPSRSIQARASLPSHQHVSCHPPLVAGSNTVPTF